MTEDQKLTGENPFIAGFVAGFAAGRSPRSFTQDEVIRYYDAMMERINAAQPALFDKLSQNESNN